MTLASDYNHSKAQYMLGLLYELGLPLIFFDFYSFCAHDFRWKWYWKRFEKVAWIFPQISLDRLLLCSTRFGNSLYSWNLSNSKEYETFLLFFLLFFSYHLDPSKGADFYLLAANQGYHAAQFSYGYALFHGRGLKSSLLIWPFFDTISSYLFW